MTTWERFCENAAKVLLAAVPSLFAFLWSRWPKTPPEKRAEKPPTGSEDG